jgi:transcriptional regulator with XRE-family HTH domain
VVTAELSPERGPAVPRTTRDVADPGKADSNGEVSDSPDGTSDAISAALGLVGSRLREVRVHREITLVELSERTGVSKSTLSRLENGQRRPTLELLLLLAQTYRVPLDDLVGAPDVGDPRIRLKPRRVKGRTVLPLTPPGGIQAWKIIIPSTLSTPKPRTHDGFEWLYVLSGRMRLILGDEDTVLGVGEAVEFDTSRSHWFGSTGEGPAEVLSLFGRPGERIHVRTSAPPQ